MTYIHRLLRLSKRHVHLSHFPRSKYYHLRRFLRDVADYAKMRKPNIIYWNITAVTRSALGATPRHATDHIERGLSTSQTVITPTLLLLIKLVWLTSMERSD